jgi:hypothetical protein
MNTWQDYAERVRRMTEDERAAERIAIKQAENRLVHGARLESCSNLQVQAIGNAGLRERKSRMQAVAALVRGRTRLEVRLAVN